MDFSELIKTEIAFLRETYYYHLDETNKDPVFDGMVRNLKKFENILKNLQIQILKLSDSFDSFTHQSETLNEVFATNYRDTEIASDAKTLAEISTKKFKRDLQYNVLEPIKSHLLNLDQIHNIIDLRNRKLIEMRLIPSLRSEFEEIDSHLFEWLFIIEEYQGDIYDSLLQTMKYLQYEFFASAAHSIATFLPKRMEFRPMVEMTPKQMQSQLGIEKKFHTKISDIDYTNKLVNKIEPEFTMASPTVDVLSLSTLLAQGFEEGPARRALKRANNDTQQALILLVAPEESNVRIPTTLKRLQRLKELKKKMALKSEPAQMDLVNLEETEHLDATVNLRADLVNLEETVNLDGEQLLTY